MKTLICALVLLFATTAMADEVTFRFLSAIPSTDTGLIQFPPGDSPGKIIEFVHEYDMLPNLSWENALGYRSPDDIFQYASAVAETGASVHVEWSSLVLKISENLAFMPENPQTGYNAFNSGTHVALGLRDKYTGLSLLFERAHYSNGESVNNPSLNYTGLSLSVSF